MASEHELTLQTDRMQANIEDGIGWMAVSYTHLTLPTTPYV